MKLDDRRAETLVFLMKNVALEMRHAPDILGQNGIIYSMKIRWQQCNRCGC